MSSALSEQVPDDEPRIDPELLQFAADATSVLSSRDTMHDVLLDLLEEPFSAQKQTRAREWLASSQLAEANTAFTDLPQSPWLRKGQS